MAQKQAEEAAAAAAELEKVAAQKAAMEAAEMANKLKNERRPMPKLRSSGGTLKEKKIQRSGAEPLQRLSASPILDSHWPYIIKKKLFS